MGVPLLLHTAKVSRKAKVAGKGISSQYSVVAQNVKCLVMPQTEDYNITRNFVFGQDYVAVFNPNTDIRKGDKLEVSIGVELLVSGISDYKGIPLVSHMEASCTTEGV